jgi:phosphoserine phosphatase RsbU/P
MTMDWTIGVRDEKRIAALENSELVGTGSEDAFDRLVEFAAALTGAEKCCITLCDAERFTYKSTFGLPEGSAMSGNIEESFCRYVVGFGRPLVINDARNDERVLDNPAIELYGVVAWAGYPIEDANAAVLGTICLIETKPRIWSDRDIMILATTARSVSTEIAVVKLKSEVSKLRQDLAIFEARGS